MKQRSYLFLFLLLFLVFLLVFLYGLFFYFPIENRVLYTNVTVGDKIGLDITNESLVFGILTPGGTSTRTVVFSNDHDFDVYVKISVDGSISSFLYFDELVEVKKGEKKTFSFTLVAGQDAGEYIGFIRFDVFRRLNAKLFN